jgi:hypothetical protein
MCTDGETDKTSQLIVHAMHFVQGMHKNGSISLNLINLRFQDQPQIMFSDVVPHNVQYHRALECDSWHQSIHSIMLSLLCGDSHSVLIYFLIQTHVLDVAVHSVD